MNKRGQLRLRRGYIDGFSLILIILGVVLMIKNQSILGVIFILGGFIKQILSRR